MPGTDAGDADLPHVVRQGEAELEPSLGSHPTVRAELRFQSSTARVDGTAHSRSVRPCTTRHPLKASPNSRRGRAESVPNRVSTGVLSRPLLSLPNYPQWQRNGGDYEALRNRLRRFPKPLVPGSTPGGGAQFNIPNINKKQSHLSRLHEMGSPVTESTDTTYRDTARR